MNARTIHVEISSTYADAVDLIEDQITDWLMSFPVDLGVSSHAGDCDIDSHCGGVNPWRERALKAEAQLKQNQRQETK